MSLVVKEIEILGKTYINGNFKIIYRNRKRGIFKVFKRHYDLLNFYCQ